MDHLWKLGKPGPGSWKQGGSWLDIVKASGFIILIAFGMAVAMFFFWLSSHLRVERNWLWDFFRVAGSSGVAILIAMGIAQIFWFLSPSCRRLRLLDNTPRTAIIDVRNGDELVKIVGRVSPPCTLVAPIIERPCAFYAISILQWDDDHYGANIPPGWESVAWKSETSRLAVDDGTGVAVVESERGFELWGDLRSDEVPRTEFDAPGLRWPIRPSDGRVLCRISTLEEGHTLAILGRLRRQVSLDRIVMEPVVVRQVAG